MKQNIRAGPHEQTILSLRHGSSGDEDENRLANSFRKKNRHRLDRHVSLGGLTKTNPRAIMPGAQHLGFIMTTLLGIAGSIVGGLIGRLFSKPEPGSAFHPAGLIMSIIGAIILLFIWLKLAT